MNNRDARYPNYRYPISVISHAIWLYNRFAMSYRDVSDLLIERGIEVSYQTIKDWNDKFGDMFADEIKKRRHPSQDIVTLDDANHLFQEAETGAFSEYARLEPEFIDGFLDTIVDWFVERAGVAR